MYNSLRDNNFYFYFLIILIATCINPIFPKKEIMLLEGDQVDYQINLSLNSNSKLFLVFYVGHCYYCGHVLKVLKEKILENFEDEDEISFGVINLDNQNNVWSGLRFNITKIPYIILIEKNKMYYYQNSFDEISVMKFITGEKEIEDALDIPPPPNFFVKLNAVMNELTEKIENIFEKFGLKREFAGKIVYIFVIIGFFIFIYIESKIILLCRNLCFKKKKDEEKKEIIDDKKQDNKEKVKKE